MIIEERLSQQENAALGAILTGHAGAPRVARALRDALLAKGYVCEEGGRLVLTLAGHRRYLAAVLERLEDDRH